MKRIIRTDNDDCCFTLVTLTGGGWNLQNILSSKFQKPGVIEIYETDYIELEQRIDRKRESEAASV